MKPIRFLFVPLKNGEWLRDSEGKPRMYKSGALALSNLKNHDYDTMQVFTTDDILTREEFESGYKEVRQFKAQAAQQSLFVN